MLTQKMYRGAIDTQNAVNASGILNWLVAMMPEIGHELRLGEVGGGSTTDRNRHPLTILVIAKLADLSGLGIRDEDVFCRAYAACVARAHKDENAPPPKVSMSVGGFLRKGVTT